MALFPGLDVFSKCLTQPFENLGICSAANIHRQKMVRIEACLAKQFLEQLKLGVRLTRTHDDNRLGVLLSRTKGILNEPIPTHPAKLRVHNGVVHVEAGFDVEREGIHVRVLERRRQTLAVANDRLGSHGVKADSCRSVQPGKN